MPLPSAGNRAVAKADDLDFCCRFLEILWVLAFLAVGGSTKKRTRLVVASAGVAAEALAILDEAGSRIAGRNLAVAVGWSKHLGYCKDDKEKIAVDSKVGKNRHRSTVAVQVRVLVEETLADEIETDHSSDSVDLD